LIDFQKIVGFYKNILNLHVSDRVEQPEHGVWTTFIEFPNKSSTSIELIEPLGDSSPIAKFVEKNDGKIHHFCFEVDNLDEAIKHIKGSGISPISRNPKIGAHGNPVIFLHPKDCLGYLTELEESSQK
jgi:methylmalonyl-CoA/ethylmalonyl-CoA epimerase